MQQLCTLVIPKSPGAHKNKISQGQQRHHMLIDWPFMTIATRFL